MTASRSSPASRCSNASACAGPERSYAGRTGWDACGFSATAFAGAFARDFFGGSSSAETSRAAALLALAFVALGADSVFFFGLLFVAGRLVKGQSLLAA